MFPLPSVQNPLACSEKTFAQNLQIESWQAFVLACRRLCKRSITEEDIKVADLLLIQFCKRVKKVFGSKFVTPNMHMHLHLADCLQDFGPLHSFWLYSFERYNGLLGKQPTNNRSIEVQLIKRFLRDNAHLDLLNAAESVPLATQFRDIVGMQRNLTQLVFLELTAVNSLSNFRLSTYLMYLIVMKFN